MDANNLLKFVDQLKEWKGFELPKFIQTFGFLWRPFVDEMWSSDYTQEKVSKWRIQFIVFINFETVIN